MIKYVAQKHDLGCAVACVANRLGMLYDEAIQLFELPDNAFMRGYRCREIQSALRKAGLVTRLQMWKTIQVNTLPLGTIVFVKSTEYSWGHYLLKVESGWVDPWINAATTPGVYNARAGIRKNLPAPVRYAIVSENK